MSTESQTGLLAETRPLFQTDLALPGLRRGKVRDVYDLENPGGATRLLIVASDRISAFDVVMPTPIPGKGRLLSEISLFWMSLVERLGICTTHIVSSDVAGVPDRAFSGRTTREDLVGRTAIARRLNIVPIECVVRGYLEGSGWKEYQATGAVCGVKLPARLRQADKLPEPIFTPATKEDLGRHDENISFDRACEVAGRAVMEKLRELSIQIYLAASEHARSRGIIIADTKFEFGFDPSRPGEGPVLADEALTPDSSRFWPADTWKPGAAQRSFDKQFLREYLESLVAAGKWNKQAPGPALPEEIWTKTLEKYVQARNALIA